MMRRRTCEKGDPNRNLQLQVGEIQFEPASVGPLGHHLCYSTVGVSTFIGRDDAHLGMIQLSISERGVRGSSGNAWLTKEELEELMAHLSGLLDSLSPTNTSQDGEAK